MDSFKATTIIAVKKDGKTAIAGDGEVTFGQAAIMKANARKFVVYIIIKYLQALQVLLLMHLLYLKNSKQNWLNTMAI